MCLCISRFLYMWGVSFSSCASLFRFPHLPSLLLSRGYLLPSWSCGPFPMGLVCSDLWTLTLEAAVYVGYIFVVLRGSFKSSLICSSAIRFSSKERCSGRGGGYTFSRSCMQQRCCLILPFPICLKQILLIFFNFYTYLCI